MSAFTQTYQEHIKEPQWQLSSFFHTWSDVLVIFFSGFFTRIMAHISIPENCRPFTTLLYCLLSFLFDLNHQKWVAPKSALNDPYTPGTHSHICMEEQYHFFSLAVYINISFNNVNSLLAGWITCIKAQKRTKRSSCHLLIEVLPPIEPRYVGKQRRKLKKQKTNVRVR